MRIYTNLKQKSSIFSPEIMSTSPKGKLFFAEVTRGYILKIMIDSLALAMTRTIFHITKRGFYHRNVDDPELKQVLIDINFPRKNFRSYKCQEEIFFSLNLKHLQKLVKKVKKKDSIIMSISRKDPDKLTFAIRPSSTASGREQRIEINTITISRIIGQTSPFIDLPDYYLDSNNQKLEVYSHPKIVDASEFQKMKSSAVGKTVKIEMQRSNFIAFYSDNGDLYNTRLEFGEILDDSEDLSHSTDEDECSDEEESPQENSRSEGEDASSSSEEEDDTPRDMYEAEFNVSFMNVLMKLPGMCSQMEFYAPKIGYYPLKVGLQAGNLGEMLVYIKDNETIAIEREEKLKNKIAVHPKAASSSKR